MRVGAVGGTGRFPIESLASVYNLEVDWHVRSLNVGDVSAHPVEGVLFNVEAAESLAMAQVFERLRSALPRLPILLSIGWRGNIVAVAEVRSFRVMQNGYARRQGLSPRESQVLGRVRAGETNHEIAMDLGTSVSTVNRHVENILRKLHARNRAEAAAFPPEMLLPSDSARSLDRIS